MGSYILKTSITNILLWRGYRLSIINNNFQILNYFQRFYILQTIVYENMMINIIQ